MGRTTALIIAIIILAAACGDDLTTAGDTGPGGEEPQTNGLLDREFWSTSVTVDGEPYVLAPQTRIRLRFDVSSIGIDAGCNNLGALYGLEDDQIAVTEMAMTEMGCDPARHAQDDLMVRFFTDGPTVVLDGDELRLETPSMSIDLLDRRVADPAQPLFGSHWEVTGFFDEATASAFAVGEPGRFVFNPNVTITGFDGCSEFEINADIDEHGGEIQFGSLVTPDDTAGCDSAEYARQIHRSLASTSATLVIEGTNLTLTTADGSGITFASR